MLDKTDAAPPMIDASEIRFRAERRIGELMEAQRETVGLAQGRRTDLGPKPTQVGPLSEAGIDKHLADRARNMQKTRRFKPAGFVCWR